MYISIIYLGDEKMVIKELNDEQEKREMSASILKSLPNWFEIPESTQEHINESSNLPFLWPSMNQNHWVLFR